MYIFDNAIEIFAKDFFFFRIKIGWIKTWMMLKEVIFGKQSGIVCQLSS